MNKNMFVRFQASGDHIPAPPVTPPPSINMFKSTLPKNIDNEEKQDGSYDPRYNDPNFSLSNNHNKTKLQYQTPFQTKDPVENPETRIQYNQGQPNYRQSDNLYLSSTTTIPRFFPPGKLTLNRTPNGFNYSFNKI